MNDESGSTHIFLFHHVLRPPKKSEIIGEASVVLNSTRIKTNVPLIGCLAAAVNMGADAIFISLYTRKDLQLVQNFFTSINSRAGADAQKRFSR